MSRVCMEALACCLPVCTRPIKEERLAILAGLNVPNEALFIEKCLDEIYPHVSEVVIVDGA